MKNIKEIKTVNDFFEYYRLETAYAQQDKLSRTPIKPFNKKKHKKLSMGIIPGYKNYDLFYERYYSAVNILKEKQLIKSNMKVLDIGSGEGFFKLFFDQEYSELLEWHGIEIWKERAAFCEHLGYQIKTADLEKGKLPYEDNSFDILLASHVIEHIPNPSGIIKEMGRVVKKGGVILIATPTKPPIIAQLDSYYHKLGERNKGETQQAFTHKTIEILSLKSLGLTKTAVIDKRGFRIFSARNTLPLENWRWFYNLSKWLGQKFLYLVPEVNVIIQK